MIRVTTTWTSPQGSPYTTVMHFSTMLAGAQDAVSAVGTLWTGIQGWISSDIDWTVDAEVVEVAPATGETTGVTVVTPSTGSGTNTAEPVPWASQVLFRWRTGVYVAGREIRGRSFVPGFGSNNVTDGQVASGVVGGMNIALSNYLAAGGATMVVYSPTHGQAADVSVASTWNQFAVLRSRRD